MGRWHREAVTEGFFLAPPIPLRQPPAASATSPSLRDGEGLKGMMQTRNVPEL
jgi:hypothetical protein